MEPDNPPSALPKRLARPCAERFFGKADNPQRIHTQNANRQRFIHSGFFRPGLLDFSSAPGFLVSPNKQNGSCAEVRYA
jgi:hypothetical protein